MAQTSSMLVASPPQTKREPKLLNRLRGALQTQYYKPADGRDLLSIAASRLFEGAGGGLWRGASAQMQRNRRSVAAC